MNEQLDNVKNVAFYIINDFNEKGVKLDKVRLHKLLYYIYGYYFKYFNLEIFTNNFYSWCYGPVIKDLYYDMLNYDLRDLKLNGGENYNINDFYTMKLIDIIINQCNVFTTNQIINKIKCETPMLKTKDKFVIKDFLIKDYFYTNNPLNICDITLINKEKKLIK